MATGSDLFRVDRADLALWVGCWVPDWPICEWGWCCISFFFFLTVFQPFCWRNIGPILLYVFTGVLHSLCGTARCVALSMVLIWLSDMAVLLFCCSLICCAWHSLNLKKEPYLIITQKDLVTMRSGTCNDEKSYCHYVIIPDLACKFSLTTRKWQMMVLSQLICHHLGMRHWLLEIFL